jgi:hypothetical protein
LQFGLIFGIRVDHDIPNEIKKSKHAQSDLVRLLLLREQTANQPIAGWLQIEHRDESIIFGSVSYNCEENKANRGGRARKVIKSQIVSSSGILKPADLTCFY